jgi:hypothetical protein
VLVFVDLWVPFKEGEDLIDCPSSELSIPIGSTHESNKDRLITGDKRRDTKGGVILHCGAMLATQHGKGPIIVKFCEHSLRVYPSSSKSVADSLLISKVGPVVVSRREK